MRINVSGSTLCVPVPLCPNSLSPVPVVPQFHIVLVSLRPKSYCIPVPLYSGSAVSHSRGVTVQFRTGFFASQVLLCTKSTVSQSRCVPFPLCPIPAFPFTWCLSASEFQFLCVSVPLCTRLIMSQSYCAPRPFVNKQLSINQVIDNSIDLIIDQSAIDHLVDQTRHC